jgi:hypothetical protein
MARRSLGAWHLHLLGTALVVRAVAGCNYDFDEFENLGRPLEEEGGAGRGGAAGARSDAATDGTGQRDASSADAADADGADGARADAATGGRSGAGGNAGAAGSAGTGASGAAGSGGSGPGGAGGAAGGGGASIVDAGMGGNAGSATGGAAGAGTTGGNGGTGTGGDAGTGGTGTGGAGGATGGAAGSGGADAGGTAGTGSGGHGGVAIDAGPVDARADSGIDGGSSFDCAAVSGRLYQGHCYFARTTAVTWDVGAERACPAPAHLVTITTSGEQEFVGGFIAGESRWIGLRRPSNAPKNPSAFAWITGEANTFAHWNSSNGEPNYDGACVRLGTTNLWSDYPCNTALPVICERDD